MSSKRLKQIKSDIANAEKRHNWSKALDFSINLGQEYYDDQKFENAEDVYLKAAVFFPKISNVTEEDRDNEFLRLRRLVEIFAEEEYCNRDKVKKNFAQCIAFAEQPTHRLLRRVQIAYHVGAYCFHAVNPNNVKGLKKALTYAHKSLDLLKKHSNKIDLELKAVKATDDSVRRQSGIYTVLAAIYYDLEDKENAVKYNQEALDLEQRHPDPDLRYRILFSKHGFVPRSERLAIAEQLYSLIEKHHKSTEGKAMKELWALRRRELLPIIAKDVLIDGRYDSQMQDQKLDRAESFLWDLYRLDKKDEWCKSGLVTIEILRQNQAKINELRHVQNPDWRALAKLYENCGDRATSFNALEMAQEYYEEMRQCAMKLPGDITFGDLELNRLATCSLAETYMELRDFRSAALFFDDLVNIETRQTRDAVWIFHSKLSAVVAKSKSVEYSFQEKLAAFEQLLNETNGSFKKRTLEKLLEFLERDPKATEEQLETYNADFERMRIIDDNLPNSEEEEVDTTDEDDAIFDRLVRQHEHEELVEEYKDKRYKVNSHGETELIQAAKVKPLDFIKMLVEKCYYDIDAQDSGGWTALSEAVAHRRPDVVRYLVRNGANPNTQSTETLLDEKTGNHATAEGATPLMEACMNGDLAIIDTLLEGGADVLLKNKSGRTAADYIDEYLRINADDDSRSLNRGLRERSAEMRKKEIEAGVAERAKKPDLPQRAIPTAPVVHRKPAHAAPAVMQYQKVIGDLGARTKTNAIRATERDVTSLNLSDDEFDAPEAMEFDPYPTPSRRPSFYHAKTEDDIIIDDVIPAKASKRPSSGQNLSSVKRLRTLDDHFNTSNVMTTPTSTRSLQHRSSVSSGISRSSNPRRSATGSSSRHTTPTYLSSNVLLEISFIDPVSRLPIAKLVPMRCGHQTTINELCTGVQSLVVDETYTEILPYRGDVPLNVDGTVGDALRGVIRKSFELNLHLVGWTPPVPKALFQRLGVAIPDAFSRYLAGFRSKHWSFSGFGCVSRVHFPRFLQGLALILSRVDVTTITIGPDALVKDDAKTDADPLKLNENVAKWLGILLRGKAEINIIGDSIEDAWLERISIQHDMSRHVDSLVLRQGRYSCRSVASFLQHCGSPVTLDLSFTELTACNEASWDTVVSEICNFSRLTTLRLAGTAVSTSQVQRILNVCPNLQKLNVSNTSIDLSALKSDHITHLKATNMKTKPIDLTPVSRNFTKLIHLDVSLGTATIADALQHVGHRRILIVALFCQVGTIANLDFTTLNAALSFKLLSFFVAKKYYELSDKVTNDTFGRNMCVFVADKWTRTKKEWNFLVFRR